MLNLLLVWSNEVAFENVHVWARLCYAEMGFQGVLAVVWVGMGVCGCVAVHKWRVGRKGEGYGKGERRDSGAESWVGGEKA
jgi:hypothetical protein